MSHTQSLFIMHLTLIFRHSLVGLLLLLPLLSRAQSSDAVGIGVRVPTEELDVKGGLRIRSLPLPKAPNSIHTLPDGTYSSNRDQELSSGPIQRYLMSNSEGVLGEASAVKPTFFHMPCIPLPIEKLPPVYNSGTDTFTLDLYAAYVAQFTDPSAVPLQPMASSPTAGTLPIEQALDLEYYITYYDPAVFTDVSIDNNGVLSYKVLPGAEATRKTFMDVIFKLK